MSLTAALRDLNKLNTFVRVAERRSFTRAAADLRTTPSVVSKRMRELEEALGFQLMNRSTHGVVLTEAGEGLFHNCIEALAQIDDYVVEARNMQTGPYGTLRLQAASDYSRFVLTPIVMEFARQCPTLRVHLFVTEDSCVASEDGFDAIIANRAPSAPGLAAHDLGAVEHVVCASPGYFRRFGKPREPQDLREHNCLINLYSGAKEWPFKLGTRAVNVEVKGTLSSNSAAVLIQMAVEGCGIVRVPRYAVGPELAHRRLEPALEASAASPERVSIYCSKGRHLPAKTTEFIQFLRAALAKA